ncbi:MAG: hypothetical protein HXX19_04545 [Rhodoferax sp.]|nr:hypothetical protein [Rhodoferax sp.]
MLPHLKGFPTTVELYSSQFWTLYSGLTEMRQAFLDGRATEPQGHIPFSIELGETKYYSDDIFSVYREFEDYREAKGISTEERDAEISKRNRINHRLFDEFNEESNDDFIASLTVGEVVHAPRMDFKLWELALTFIGAFVPPDPDECDWIDDPRGWSPPSNFRDGTDDEREIWDDYHKKR